MRLFMTILSLLLTMAFFGSCAGTVPLSGRAHVQWAEKKWNGTSLGDLAKGRQLYITRCSGCHSLSAPDRYSEREWKDILTRMAPKAKVGHEDEELIMKYLVTQSQVRIAEGAD